MKRIVVSTANDALLTTLELLLRHWGYRVLATPSMECLAQSLRDFTPDLLLVDGAMLATDEDPLAAAIAARVTEDRIPLIVLVSAGTNPPDLPHQTLTVPLDIFELFALIQQHLEKIPRRNLRMAVKLPALLSRNDSSQFADILSLSSHGLFVKTSLQVRVNDTLHIVLPLMGMKQEIEIECRVIYCVSPSLGNNYLQGFGLEFVEDEPARLKALQQFLESSLLEEVGRHHQEIDAATETLNSQRLPLTLRLPSSS